MSSFFAEIVAELLGWYLDIKFWFKKRKRRKFEKENNLPKRLMIYPSDKIYIALVGICSISIFMYILFIYPDVKEKRTREKLAEIVQILEKEKQVLGVYPNELNAIIRNNPLRQGLTEDYWNNKIYYKLTNEGSYMLFSLGKDGTPNTDDDIVLEN
ncbi:type II secretion system protein GspG [uncultured Winogradskyella sp.]|uniref:type II secretion system protein GspG n=1 Tax=uncultured Winogradskyella sp. TaxID=395353 RepID=UPI002606E6DC|nr:type II secretion system protein GspG [uncultured Winogradskyella sp.]